MLMFLSPIFFPISAMPPRWQPLLKINPLAQIIEQTRRVAVQGLQPSWIYLFVGIVCGIITCEISLRIFKKSKNAFADVI